MEIFDLLLIIELGGLISGFVIWIVSKLGLGLEVDGFANAFGAAIVIAMLGGLLNWLLSIMGISDGVGWLIPKASQLLRKALRKKVSWL